MKRQPRELRWSDAPPRPIPQHPYRDTVLVYGFLALLVVIIAWATGGPVIRSLELAAAFFAAAVVWSWFRWHQRGPRPPREEEL